MRELSAQDKKRLETINKKGWEVAKKLEEVKARQDTNFEKLAKAFGDEGDKKEPPEVRLRRYLDMINRARKRMLDDEYGGCIECDKPFKPLELDEMPWVERCHACDIKY